jgi:protein tyrosine phosphatase (PTP) superfamily phosphohydrolase (DUF442 family)
MRASFVPWVYGLTLLGLLIGISFGYYRWRYDHGKRLRVVTPGKVYRSGQLTADGFEEALRRYGIRTVLNLQEESPDPEFPDGMRESQICRRLGARFEFIFVDLVCRWQSPEQQPTSLERLYELLDDPSNYPLLIHCRAGLHRTGILTAIYRMEYERWTLAEAMAELKDHGFGDKQCTSRNEYIRQYLVEYESRAAKKTTAQPSTSVGIRKEP